jgi:tetratricopeptide (TPR) repeat protein
MPEKQRFDNIDDYIADLRGQLGNNAECGVTWYNLGVAKRDFLEAEKAFRQAVDNSPSLAEGYVQLGGIALQRGDLEGCLNYNRIAAQTRNFFATPWGNMGFVYLQMGDVKNGAKALEKAVKFDPKFVQALATLGSAYLMEKDYERAVDACNKALEVEPMFGPAWNNLALAYLETGEAAKAAEALAKADESGFDVRPELRKEIERLNA